MDVEAQVEEIRELIRTKSYTYSSLYVHGSHSTPKEIRLLLEELGYRKLPDGKPPLIEIDPHSYNCPADVRIGAETQRDDDIKFYGGNNGQAAGKNGQATNR